MWRVTWSLLLCAGAVAFDGSGEFTLPFDPNGGVNDQASNTGDADAELPFDPSGGSPLPFDPNGGGAAFSSSSSSSSSSSTDHSADLDVTALMNQVEDLPPDLLNGGAPVPVPAPLGADDVPDIDVNALMHGLAGDVPNKQRPSFEDQLNALQDDDPSAFAAYGGEEVGSGACMGGFLKDLDLFVDCTKIMGFVAVVNSDLQNLDKLRNLREIAEERDMAGPNGNGLYIANNTNLVDISGLSALELVHGGLLIEGNPQLKSTAGLGNNLNRLGHNNDGESIIIRANRALEELGGWDLWQGELEGGLTVDENVILSHLKGLGGLTKVGGAIRIHFNEHLSDISGLANVRSVGKDRDGNSVVVVHNRNLRDLTGLRGLQGMLAGAVKISSNEGLTSVDGLEQVLGIGRDEQGVSLSIRDNAALESVQGLGSVQGRLAGAVEVRHNPSLKVLAGLQAISELGADLQGRSLDVASNLILDNLVGFSGLEKVDGSINIAENPSLKYLVGLDKLNTILGKDKDGDSLRIASNGALESLKNLLGVHGELDGALSVVNNTKLASLDGLEHITALNGKNIRGNALEVIMNDELKDLTGLEGLSGYLKGSITVGNNAALEDTKGLCAPKVDGVQIFDNPNLAYVHGLKCTTEVKGKTTIRGNKKLEDVVPLEENLAKTGGAVTVKDVKCVSSKDVWKLKRSATSPDTVDVTLTSKGECGAAARKRFGNKDRTSVGTAAKATVCGAVSGKKSAWGKWSMFGSTGIYMDVDTSNCLFKQTPGYVTSVYGDSAHWQLVGVNSIYEATANKFRVYTYHPVLRGQFMQYFAERYNWRLAWLADSGKTSGRTTGGNSGWKALKKTQNVLYLDVSTEKSGYDSVPRYVTALHGGRNHWKVQGVHSIYEPSQFGFRVFLVYPTSITVGYAEKNKWSVAWVGSTDNAISGRSSNEWTKFVPPRTEKVDALWMDVDTSGKHFPKLPTYVTSVSGTSHHWKVTGAASIYAATATNFRVYLDRAESAAFAQKNDWRVNYITARASHDCHISAWTTWGSCSTKCGGGVATRNRIILEPAIGKGTCNFALDETKACNTQKCIVDCKVAAWGAWGACSATCGSGTEARTRDVATDPSLGGKPCPKLVQEQVCDAGSCPQNCEVSVWGAWDDCTHSCNTGTQKRKRGIRKFAASGGFKCPVLEQSQQCNTHFCPVDCQVTEWSEWGLCSKSCGWGIQTRVRVVKGKGAQHGGRKCPPLRDIKPCHPDHCPVHCTVSPWSLFGACSKTCGGGVRTRTRTVLQHAQHRGYECPALTDEIECNEHACAVDCVVGDWEAWGVCSATCGTGSQKRSRRRTTQPAHGGKDCPTVTDTRECNTQECPIDCATTAWTPWSRCSASCGSGSRWRMREVTTHAQYGGAECLERFQQQLCDAGPCAEHCTVGEWTGWTTCTQSCGTGAQSRARTVLSQAKNGGSTCPTLEEHRECNTKFCPVDCVVSEWGAFDECSKSCAGSVNVFAGEHTRLRTIIQHPKHGGKGCPPLSEKAKCNTHACPFDCETTEWRAWSECSRSCGHGTKVRKRTIVTAAANGGQECPTLFEKDACDAGNCPQHCEVDEWSEWSACTHSCTGATQGSRTRSRNIVRHAAHGGFECPALFQVGLCNDVPCPVDCELAQWAKWGACTATCGQGTHVRTRLVKIAAKHGGKPCTNIRHEQGSCHKGPCPSHCQVSSWGKWSDCTHSCTDASSEGTRTRIRTITTKNTDGGFVCPALSEQERCNTQACPVDCRMTQWGSWSPCTATCSAGMHHRERVVLEHAAHGGKPCGHKRITKTCNLGKCPVHCTVSAWSPWNECSKDCGGGKQERSRTVDYHAEHGGFQCPSLSETRACHTHACPTDCKVGPWTPQSACSQHCGGGQQRYTRSILQRALNGGIDCPLLGENRPCNTKPCTVDCVVAAWGKWEACSHTCGSGTQRRSRTVVKKQLAGGKHCPSLSMGRGCNAGTCPQHCEVSAWSIWSGCTKTCAGGTRARTRIVVRTAIHGGYVCPALQEIEQCNVQDCPVDCVMSEWGPFTECSKSCTDKVQTSSSLNGPGRQYRFREVVRQPAWGGRACSSVQSSRVCNTQACPVDCGLDNWGAWSACSVTCGRGEHMRSRAVLQAALFGGEACQGTDETRACLDSPCPLHCEVGAWSKWDHCTHSCGGGVRVRYRDITQHAKHDGFQCPALYEQELCNPHMCPVDCRVSNWGSFGACTRSCGGGEKTRERVVVLPPKFGGEACPTLSDTVACGTRDCPVHCTWSAWQAWGPCSKTCNDGQQTRTRVVVQEAAHGGLACPGDAEEKQHCHLEPCPVHCVVSEWSEWGACSKSCGGGLEVRKRKIVTQDRHGGSVCPLLADSRSCNVAACPVDCVASEWSKWDNFAGGKGLVTRSRTVVSPARHGGRGCGELAQKEPWHKALHCTAKDVYGAWSECTQACDSGHKYRYRKHISCSQTAVLRMHMVFRQGVLCNTRKCGEGEKEVPRFVKVPAPPQEDGFAVAATQLSEELQGGWERVVSADERQAAGLEDAGTWERRQL